MLCICSNHGHPVRTHRTPHTTAPSTQEKGGVFSLPSLLYITVYIVLRFSLSALSLLYTPRFSISALFLLHVPQVSHRPPPPPSLMPHTLKWRKKEGRKNEGRRILVSYISNTLLLSCVNAYLTNSVSNQLNNQLITYACPNWASSTAP